MSIGPVELNGAISRTIDFTAIKHNEDNKGIVNQSNFQTQFKKDVEHKIHRVNQSDDAPKNQSKFDAKEKGNGAYNGDGGKRKNIVHSVEDKVIEKRKNVNFDIRI